VFGPQVSLLFHPHLVRFANFPFILFRRVMDLTQAIVAEIGLTGLDG
jgi:hypothetical protein